MLSRVFCYIFAFNILLLLLLCYIVVMFATHLLLMFSYHNYFVTLYLLASVLKVASSIIFSHCHGVLFFCHLDSILVVMLLSSCFLLTSYLSKGSTNQSVSCCFVLLLFTLHVWCQMFTYLTTVLFVLCSSNACFVHHLPVHPCVSVSCCDCRCFNSMQSFCDLLCFSPFIVFLLSIGVRVGATGACIRVIGAGIIATGAYIRATKAGIKMTRTSLWSESKWLEQVLEQLELALEDSNQCQSNWCHTSGKKLFSNYTFLQV